LPKKFQKGDTGSFKKVLKKDEKKKKKRNTIVKTKIKEKKRQK